MADGSWTIKQWNPNSDRHSVTKIVVGMDGESGEGAPRHEIAPHGLVLTETDGTQTHWPWCSIVKAEYVPPTRDDSWPGQGDTL